METIIALLLAQCDDDDDNDSTMKLYHTLIFSNFLILVLVAVLLNH